MDGMGQQKTDCWWALIICYWQSAAGCQPPRSRPSPLPEPLRTAPHWVVAKATANECHNNGWLCFCGAPPPLVLQEQHQGRNKPLRQEVEDAFVNAWLGLPFNDSSSRTAAPSTDKPSFRSVSLGKVLRISESSRGEANGCLMSMSSRNAGTPTPCSGFSLKSG